MAESLKVAAETGDINGLYGSIKEDSHVLDRIDAIPFVDTPLHIAASAGHTDFAIEILRLKPSFGRKLNPDGLSSLHLALINDKFETVKRFIKFDKELIRIKGREGANPLHYIAEKANDGDQKRMDDPINADQQQRGTDEQQRALPKMEQEKVADDRINILAEFLFACPNSVGDLTIHDKTALHIAVKSKNKKAVAIILGCIFRIERKIVLDYKDKEGNTALHMAESTSQDAIVSSLRSAGASSEWHMQIARSLCSAIARSLCSAEASSRRPMQIAHSLCSAGALESSSPDPSLAEFLNSPEGHLEVLFKLGFLLRRSVSMELRNIGLVVAALIATATFTAVLSPPGGVGGPGDNNLFTNGSNINATVSSTNNLSAANTSFINATLFVPTDDPLKRLLFKGVRGAELATYGNVFGVFYSLNTVAFFLSMLMIMFVLPLGPFTILHAALWFMMGSYGVSFNLISPSYNSSLCFMCSSIWSGTLIYLYRGLIEDFLFGKRDKRLRLLERLMMNSVGQ